MFGIFFVFKVFSTHFKVYTECLVHTKKCLENTSFLVRVCLSLSTSPVGIRRQYNVVTTSLMRRDVAQPKGDVDTTSGNNIKIAYYSQRRNNIAATSLSINIIIPFSGVKTTSSRRRNLNNASWDIYRKARQFLSLSSGVVGRTLSGT